MKERNRMIVLLLCLALLLSACATGTRKEPAAEEAAEKNILTRADKSDRAEEAAVPEKAEGAGKADADLGMSFSGLSDALNVKDDPVKTGELEEPGAGMDGASGTTANPAPTPGQELVLTAAEWNDNRNWPFFTNLVNSGSIHFPSFGIDPRLRVAVQVADAAGEALPNEPVQLLDAEGAVLWSARTDKAGTAYLFHTPDQTPSRVVCGSIEAPVQLPTEDADSQSGAMRPLESIQLTAAPSAPGTEGLQVMFIVDTTGSMGDELAYLQKDFSAIAERVGGEAVRYAVSFYRDRNDDYVTRHNEFTADVAQVQAQLNAEFADGGGDTPEAVAEVLTECLTDRTDWEEGTAKLAFLIFDAPPHDGKEEALRSAVQAAAEKGIRLIPVVASNAERETELFGRALAICTNGTYVFLTDDSGVGDSHLEPIVGKYEVEKLQDLIVRIIEQYR